MFTRWAHCASFVCLSAIAVCSPGGGTASNWQSNNIGDARPAARRMWAAAEADKKWHRPGLPSTGYELPPPGPVNFGTMGRKRPTVADESFLTTPAPQRGGGYAAPAAPRRHQRSATGGGLMRMLRD